MAECKDCIHYCVCSHYPAPNERYPEVGGCGCFKPSTDLLPKEFLTRKEDEAYERGYAEAKSEVDEFIGAFDVWLYKHYNGDISDWDLYKLFAALKKKYTEGQE